MLFLTISLFNDFSFLTTIYIKIKPTTNCAIPVPSAAPATPKFSI